ncbi:MAG: PPC domain-containing protein [Pyrinomonadaceae bacterium]
MNNRLNVIAIVFLLIFASLGCKMLQQSREIGGGLGNNENAEANADETVSVPDMEFPENNESSENSTGSTSKETFDVKFDKGTSSKEYSKQVPKGSQHSYNVDAKAGQTLSVQIESENNDATFVIIKPGGGYLYSAKYKNPTNYFEAELPQSGRYVVTVLPGKNASKYKLNLGVTGGDGNQDGYAQDAPAANNQTRTVNFKKGDTFARYSDAVVLGSKNTYLIGAKAGQRMEVTLDSTENNAIIAIYTPEGKTLIGATDGWNGELPTSGKYRVVVSSTRGNASYDIGFSIN